MKHWKQRLHFYIVTLAIMGAVSCTNEEVHIDSPTSPDVNTDKVKLTMKVSVPSSPGMTRATGMEDATESLLETVKILAFKVADGDTLYAYTTDGVLSNDKKKITAEVKRSNPDTDQYCFLLIVNHPNGKLPALTGMNIKQVKSEITYDYPETGWGHSKGIPMSGVTEAKAILGETEFGEIRLTRAMARVDVGVNYKEGFESASGLDPDVFRLRSVSVYRYNTKGKIVEGVYDSRRADKDSLRYLNPEPGQTELGRFMNGFIYLPESEAGDFSTATCLIIGAKYSTVETNWSSLPMNYYRVDFLDKEGKHLPIKRNHRYIMNIKSVAGEGYATEQEALKNAPANISVQITEWNEILGDVEVSGNTHFACETRNINLGYKKDSYITIKAESSVPVDEWQIKVDAAWNKKIEVTKVKSKDPNKGDIIFKALADGDGSDAKKVVMQVGYVTVTFTVSQEKGIYAQPDDIVVEGWSPSDKEEDILTDDPKK